MHDSDSDPRSAGAVESTGDRLLPPDAYPDDLDEAARARLDIFLGALAGLIPDEPGTYLDGEGDPWVRDADGSWTDLHGVRRGPAHTPLLALFGPWRRAGEPGDVS